jgi:hypothetical protein
LFKVVERLRQRPLVAPGGIYGVVIAERAIGDVIETDFSSNLRRRIDIRSRRLDAEHPERPIARPFLGIPRESPKEGRWEVVLIGPR